MQQFVTGKMPARLGSNLYPWVVVAVLMLLYTSSFIDRQILGLLVKPMRADLGITDTQFSYLIGFSFALLYSVAGVPLGYVVDRWNRSHLIVIGTTLWSLTTASCGLVSTYWALFAARIGVGVGEATLSPATYSMVADTFPPERLSRALSVFGLGVPVGAGLALVIGGPMVEWLTAMGPVDLPVAGVTKPWQMVFFIIGLPGLLLALLAYAVVREPPRRVKQGIDDVEKPSVGAVFSYLWRNRVVYTPLFLGFSVVALFWYGASNWYPTYLQRVRGFSVGEAGLFLGSASLVLGVIGTMLAGTLADRFLARGKADGHFRVGIMFTIGGLICGAWGPLVPIPWLSLTLIFINGLFSFTWVCVNAAAIQLVTPNRMRGQVSAIYLFVVNFTSLGLGPTAVAFSTDHIFQRDDAVGLSIALVGTVAMILGCVIMYFGRKVVAAKISEMSRGE